VLLVERLSSLEASRTKREDVGSKINYLFGEMQPHSSYAPALRPLKAKELRRISLAPHKTVD
jgi:hypothetical protein